MVVSTSYLTKMAFFDAAKKIMDVLNNRHTNRRNVLAIKWQFLFCKQRRFEPP